jgi:cellobiose-specific phosphotransferase system component IIC
MSLRRQPTFPVLKALRNTMIYNLGSVAFGSFIIAIIQFVRVSDERGVQTTVLFLSCSGQSWNLSKLACAILGSVYRT